MGDYKDDNDAQADEPEWVTEERKKFKELYDKDNDGKLNKEEVSVFFMFQPVKYSKQDFSQQFQQSCIQNPWAFWLAGECPERL